MKSNGFSDMKRLLDKTHNWIETNDSDRFFLVCGYEGTGKSTFVKKCFHYWYENVLKMDTLNKEKQNELLQFFTFSKKDWANGLKIIHQDKLKCMFLTCDEAVNILYYRDSTSKKAKKIKKIMNQLRYMNILQFMQLPRFWQIDRELLTSRISGVFWIFKNDGRHYAAFYPRKLIGGIVTEIEYKMKLKKDPENFIFRVDNMKTQPYSIFEFSMYNGWVQNNYDDKKHEIVGEAIDELNEEVGNKEKKEKLGGKSKYSPEAIKTAIELVQEGLTHKEASKQTNIPITTIKYYKTQYEATGTPY